jgi:hypothetical protein
MIFAVQLAHNVPPNSLFVVRLLLPPFVLMPWSSILHTAQCGIDGFALL